MHIVDRTTFLVVGAGVASHVGEILKLRNDKTYVVV